MSLVIAVFGGPRHMTDEDALAAVLHGLLEAGVVQHPEVIAFIDRDCLLSDSPPVWLINASLATDTAALLKALSEPAAGHPMQAKPVNKALDIAACLLADGANPIRTAEWVLDSAPWESWPPDLLDSYWHLDDEARCGCAHGGAPDEECVREALWRVIAIAGPTKWRDNFRHALAAIRKAA